MMVFQPQGQRGGGTCADKPRERTARGVDEHSSSRGWHGPHAGEPSGAGGPRSSTQRRTASLGVRKDLLRYECVFCTRTHTRTRTPMSNCELLPHPRLHPAFTQRPSFPTGTPFQSHVRRTALRLAQIRNPPSLPRHPCLQSCQERARRPQDPTPGRSEGGDGNAAGLVGLWNPAAGACPAGPASGTLRYHRFFKLWQNMQFTLFAITSRRH